MTSTAVVSPVVCASSSEALALELAPSPSLRHGNMHWWITGVVQPWSCSNSDDLLTCTRIQVVQYMAGACVYMSYQSKCLHHLAYENVSLAPLNLQSTCSRLFDLCSTQLRAGITFTASRVS